MDVKPRLSGKTKKTDWTQQKCGYMYKCLLNVSWKDKHTNESILEELSTKRILLQEINRRKLKYVGHAVRNPKTDLMASILQGRVEGRRNRGRPPMSYMDNITAISGLTLGQVIHRSRDRDDWRAVVARSEAATDDHGDTDRWQVWNGSLDEYDSLKESDRCDQWF